MATLQPGEKARMYALGKIARGGATRGGYVSGRVFIGIDGIHVGFGGTPGAGHVGTLIESLTITDELNEAPNTCQFRVNGLVPAAGAAIRVTIGSKNGGSPLFAGIALTIDQRYAMVPRNVQADVHCVDWCWLLGFLKVTERYTNASASTIAADLVTKYAAANGFSGAAITPYLPNVDVITFTNEDLDKALTRLAQRIGGYWYVDYNKSVHVFTEETTNGAPEALTPQHKSLADFTRAADRTQVLTRCYVEGRGTTILGAVAPGDTLIPVAAIDMFTGADASVFLKVSPHASDGGAKHLSFTGTVQGLLGSLVGPGGGPPGKPNLALSATAGNMAPATYQYAYTDLTAAGETAPSPLAAITIGAVVNPPIPTTAAAVTAQVAASGGVTVGTHRYAYTYVTAAGAESLAGPDSATVQTQGAVPLTGGISSGTPTPGGSIPYGDYLYYATYIGNLGGESTTNSSYGVGLRATGADSGKQSVTLFFSIPPAGVTQIKIYRTVVNNMGGPAYFIGAIAPGVSSFYDAGTVTPGAAKPLSNTAIMALQQIRVTTPAAADATVTGVKLYRKRTDIAGSYKLVAQVDGAQGGVTYYDTKADGSLGASAPPVTLPAAVTAVAISNIVPGPTGTTSRAIYRTAQNGSQLRWLATLTDNAQTALTDVATDAALGVNAPTSDTSGLLNQTAGQVGAGSVTLPVGTAAPFEATGGWAVVGNGEQVIRYTGKTDKTLTGIPATGIGAITASVAYNSTVTAAPMITGVPAAGARAIREAITAGDDLNLVVQCDNAARQTDLANMVHVGPGVREEWIQDRRLSITEARARGLATLAARPLEAVTVTYRCRDLRTASGKTITVNLPAPTSVTGTYKIQTVVINNFRPFPTQYPTFTVTASSNQFSFEDWLRRLETKA